MDEAVAQCIRIRYLEHALESSKRKGHASTSMLKLSDAPFDAVDQQICPVDTLSVLVLQDWQITAVLGRSQHTEPEPLHTVQDPLCLLIPVSYTHLTLPTKLEV